ncbi:hypothetical protein [Kangiella sediminilitoris]|uniref:Uncharacterized protein n=1 Tax=Kangiella sediminilitoris TaxID=1144748 RepID=A0A1B3BDR9_9GAMM|nr:hypothetical protein [Kangiella sediminilitoris]AOE50918.1 hypothetical protein KS2013_2213 [Kangiella sediminilitoris]
MSQPVLTILKNILLIALASVLLAIACGLLLPFLQSLGLLDDLGGHGLGNFAYLFYGALFGGALGLVLAIYMVTKHPHHLIRFFTVLAVLAIVVVGAVLMCIHFFGISW